MSPPSPFFFFSSPLSSSSKSSSLSFDCLSISGYDAGGDEEEPNDGDNCSGVGTEANDNLYVAGDIYANNNLYVTGE